MDTTKVKVTMEIEDYIEKIVDNGRVEDMEELSDMLEDTMEIVQKYDILCPSLPGYFLNHMGDFSEKTRKFQIDYVSAWCSKYYRDNVYILGYSLGCHFAILLADVMKTNCKHLLLTNPFLTDKTAARWAVGNNIGCCGCLVSPLYKSKLDNGEKIKQVKCPIDFFYSLHDKIVNPQDAHTLYDIAKNNGNNQVSLLPHFNISDVKDIPKSIVNKIKDNTCFWPIESLDNIIDSGKINYSFKHCEICYSHGLFFRLKRCPPKKLNIIAFNKSKNMSF